MLVDTHSHIYFKDFHDDIDHILERAHLNGVHHMVAVGIDLESSKQAIELAHRVEGVSASIGLHPHDANQYKESDMSEFRELAKDSKVVAVGEIGLDFFRNHSTAEEQYQALDAFLDLALEVDLPIIVHVRDAFDQIYQVFSKKLPQPVNGILHCFSGDLAEMERFLELGFLISFAGHSTYKKNVSLRECLEKVPADRYILETDCPYMSPLSVRGKRNEPSFMVETADMAAQVRNVLVGQIMQESSQNAARIFNLDLSHQKQFVFRIGKQLKIYLSKESEQGHILQQFKKLYSPEKIKSVVFSLGDPVNMGFVISLVDAIRSQYDNVKVFASLVSNSSSSYDRNEELSIFDEVHLIVKSKDLVKMKEKIPEWSRCVSRLILQIVPNHPVDKEEVEKELKQSFSVKTKWLDQMSSYRSAS